MSSSEEKSIESEEVKEEVKEEVEKKEKKDKKDKKEKKEKKEKKDKKEKKEKKHKKDKKEKKEHKHHHHSKKEEEKKEEEEEKKEDSKMEEEHSKEEKEDESHSEEEKEKKDNETKEFIPVEDVKLVSVFVKNIPYGWATNDMYQYFASSGPVKTRVITNKETGKSRGFGYLDFVDLEAANKFVEEHQGEEVDGRPLFLDLADGKKGGDKDNNGGKFGAFGSSNKTGKQHTYKGKQGGDNVCFNCGKPGHMSRECPEPRKDNRKGGFKRSFNENKTETKNDPKHIRFD
ncbi:RNA recognition motif domain-containing protein [Entamoeba histolytica HM-3:IMSS]|uniref:RNA recognition motif domain-containing protein n=1 Tax=Entamoeba histolytica HM-3:IMSS TaxID=885315 RepID=M7WAD6_ENTHI|nr:RNA recognition motif domain-containing protein [Entamoeba histolytica HM-3:IMSS]